MLFSSRRAFALAIVFVTLGCTSPTAPDALVAAPAPPASPVVSTVLSLTNEERARAGLAPLRENAQLNRAAQLHTDQMGASSRLEHVIPGAPYPNPIDRLAAAHYDWQSYGENIAMGQRSSAEVVSAWMNSAGHRANILNPRYTELGVGYALDGNGRPYYAQVFARPM